MAWDITKPSDSGAVADACAYTRANFVAADTALKKEHEDMALANGGEHLSGSARTYYDDYDLLANLPDLLAGDHIGYATGRLAFNNSANMPNQGWIFDGALWQPLVSPRYSTATGNGDNDVVPAAAWVVWDAALDNTLYMTDNGDWQYELEFSGAFNIQNASGGAAAVELRFYDNTLGAEIAACGVGYFAGNGFLITQVNFKYLFTPPAAGNRVIRVEVYAPVGVTLTRDTPIGGNSRYTHTLTVKEIPA